MKTTHETAPVDSHKNTYESQPGKILAILLVLFYIGLTYFLIVYIQGG